MTTLLKCTGLCLRRKPRTDFRETPWHGRAAACMRCEGFRHVDHLYAEQRWRLEQEREKVAALVRHVGRLRLQRVMERAPFVFGLDEEQHEPTRRRKRARLTLKLERKK